MQWSTTKLQSDADAFSRMQNALTLQRFLQREPLSSYSHVSLLPPTRKKVRESKQLADGLMVSGANGDGEYFFRLGVWALHWLPGFILAGRKRRG